LVNWIKAVKESAYILSYKQALRAGASAVGSKAYNLALCHHSGFHLPEGFIIANEAFWLYMKADLPPDFFSQIEGLINSSERIIVRSSALEEDRAKASFAGQYLSIICNGAPSEFKQACEACWSSYFSSSAESYLKNMNQNSSQSKGGMGLVVQKTVNAVSSGVCFTKDPMDQRKTTYVINAVHGLGEVLMSGEVMADQYAVNVQTDGIDYKISGRQDQWRVPSDHQVLAALPPDLRNRIVLSKNQILEVRDLARKAGSIMGSPQDIEWAYDARRLFLLQTRPITTGKRDHAYELWTRDNVADVIPDVVTTLSWSIIGGAVNNGFKTTIRKLGLQKNPVSLFALFDDRAYCNLTNYRSIYSIREDISKIPGIALRYVRLLLTLKGDIKSLEDQFQRRLNYLSEIPLENAMRGLKSMLDTYMAVHLQNAILMDIGFSVIRKLISGVVPENKENFLVDGLVTGLSNVESASIAEPLIELAFSIRKNQELVRELLASTPEKVPEVLRENDGEIALRWKAYLKKYGYASLKEFEIYYPRWKEDPTFIAKTLLQYLRKKRALDLNAGRAKCAKRRAESEAYLLRHTPLPRRLPLRFYIRHVRLCSIWRESLKQKLVRIMALFRKRALVFAGEMHIEPSENVFFLTLDEICRIEEPSMVSAFLSCMSERKTAWETSKNKEAFKEIRLFDDGRKLKVPYLSGAGTQLQGFPLSSGTSKGRARIVLNPNKIESFDEGDILVAPSTNPSWTPLFAMAGAIVTDMGNYLSHGSIVAREMGIPAVGNLFHATKTIKDGAIIEVDGNTGLVTVI